MACRSRRVDTELVRAGRTPEGQWYLGRGPGRGVWMCANATCGAAVQVGQVARALRHAVSASDVAALREKLVGLELAVVVKE
ncbi:MAG: YlxR family protein [Acidobacteria bacterium]|nr:YlxR family protein [Acidobacteriota bacterium]